MDINEQFNEMAEAIEEAIIVQKKYAEALEELKKENQFLADTITNNKLGKISTVRRALLAKVAQAEKEASIAIKMRILLNQNMKKNLKKLLF